MAQKRNWFGPFRQTGKQTLSSWYQKHLWEIVLEPQTLKPEGFENPKILCLNICDVLIYPDLHASSDRELTTYGARAFHPWKALLAAFFSLSLISPLLHLCLSDCL